MSTYFDYIVEQPEAESWKAVAKSTYEDNEAINPRILKSVFWDTEFYNCDLKNLSEEALYMFTEKVGKFYNRKAREAFRAKDVKTSVIPVSNNPKGLLATLSDLANDYRTKARDTLVEVKLSAIPKYWDVLKFYLDVPRNTCPIDEHTLQSWINTGIITNIVFVDGLYYWLYDTPWQAMINIKSGPFEIFTENVAQFIYLKDEKELLQYQIKPCARVSTAEDIDSMVLELKKSIGRLKKANSIENLVKISIQDLLEEKSIEEDKATNLYRELSEFCKDVDNCSDDDWLEDLETQLSELVKLQAVVDTKGRLIWGIE